MGCTPLCAFRHEVPVHLPQAAGLGQLQGSTQPWPLTPSCQDRARFTMEPVDR